MHTHTRVQQTQAADMDLDPCIQGDMDLDQDLCKCGDLELHASGHAWIQIQVTPRAQIQICARACLSAASSSAQQKEDR